jgi:hypothetical protein
LASPSERPSHNCRMPHVRLSVWQTVTALISSVAGCASCANVVRPVASLHG